MENRSGGDRKNGPGMLRRMRAHVGAAALVLAGLAAALAAITAHRFDRDIEAERARVAAGASVLQTACGPIQYAEVGKGVPILAIPGAGGGYDQGLDDLKPLAERGFRVIAVSRFGYLGTPLPEDASVKAQARAHACLLDALRVPAAAIFAQSTGASSAVQFAILYPKRTTHLVLSAPALHGARGGEAPWPSAFAEAVYEASLRSDFLYWSLMHAAPGVLTSGILATPPDRVKEASPAEQERVARTMKQLLPITDRRAGLENDALAARDAAPHELERIKAPTLLIGAADDLSGAWDGARLGAQRIANARLVGYPKGGHLLVGSQRWSLDEVSDFIRSPKPKRPRRYLASR
jgi:2-hydroxy-6-oxonona-2,4-dienedioate hydrolase